MKVKILIIFIINFLFLAGGLKPVFAMEYTEENGLFKMDIPKEWHWVENGDEVVITYPDGNTAAIDIQFVPSSDLSQPDIKKALKEGNDKMIKQGIEAHNGTLIDNKETKLDGVYATQLDFKTAAPSSIYVRYISFSKKGYVFTITYGSDDDKMVSVMDDVVATFEFK